MHAPPLCTLKRLHGDLLQQYDCTEQPPPQPPPPSAGGNAAANAGARPQPPAGSQDNSNGKLLLPQLNRLHEAFKRRQVSPSASSSSQDQQAQQPPKSVIPTQKRVTEQLTKHWRPSRPCVSTTPARASRSSASFTCHRNTRPRSRTPLRVETNALEKQAELLLKPLSAPSSPPLPAHHQPFRSALPRVAWQARALSKKFSGE